MLDSMCSYAPWVCLWIYSVNVEFFKRFSVLTVSHVAQKHLTQSQQIAKTVECGGTRFFWTYFWFSLIFVLIICFNLLFICFQKKSCFKVEGCPQTEVAHLVNDMKFWMQVICSDLHQMVYKFLEIISSYVLETNTSGVSLQQIKLATLAFKVHSQKLPLLSQ